MLARATDDLGDAAPLIADLLSVPTGDRYPPLDLTPQKRKEKTLQALLAQLEGLAARQPVLMVFEDVHWIDPTVAGAVGPDRRSSGHPAGPADHHLSAGVRAPVDRPPARDIAHAQSPAAGRSVPR